MRQKPTAWLVVLFFLAPGCSRAPEEGASVDVVVYVVDTLRRDRLGFYGYTKPTSPNLDALARTSFVFDNAYAPAPWTLPSVVSLLTSAYPVDHAINRPGQAIPKAFPTLPRRLSELGYRTAAFSANPLVGPTTALEAQFDHVEHFQRELRTKPIEHWLDAGGDAPFFLYVQTTEPHEPYVPPDPFLEGIGTVPPGAKSEIAKLTTSWRRTRQDLPADLVARLSARSRELDVLYDGTVAWADDRMAKLVRNLKRRGRWESTLFVFVSDHGEELFDHGSLFHGQSLYAELIRIPMLWRLPSENGRGARIAEPANLVDVMPTILDYLGRSDLAAGSQGRSLLGAMREGSGNPEARVTAVRIARPKDAAHASSDPNNLAVVEGRWKGVWNRDPDTFELYDTLEDPRERVDVSESHREVAERLKREAERWLAGRPEIAGISDVRESVEIDRSTRFKLRNLGYVE